MCVCMCVCVKIYVYPKLIKTREFKSHEVPH